MGCTGQKKKQRNQLEVWIRKAALKWKEEPVLLILSNMTVAFIF